MLIILSPAKSLDFETPAPKIEATLPDYLDRSQRLIERLRAYSPAELGRLMGISDALAVLNVGRYAQWATPFTAENAKAALLAFNGDVYEGLEAKTLSASDLAFAQQRLRILSGLYGVLRPLDLIQPYRLEMGTRLAMPEGMDLYAFWGDAPTAALNAALREAKAKTLVNLASDEYSRVVRPAQLKAPIVQPVFEDWSGSKFKVVSFYAKRARGRMARYAIAERLRRAEDLKAFDADGYRFDEAASSEARWIFRRRL